MALIDTIIADADGDDTDGLPPAYPIDSSVGRVTCVYRRMNRMIDAAAVQTVCTGLTIFIIHAFSFLTHVFIVG